MLKKVTFIITVIVLLSSLFFLISFQPRELHRIETTNIRSENFLNSINSPDGSITLNIYLTGGDILKADYTFLGEVVFNDSNEEPKNVFLVGEDNNFTYKWIDNETIQLMTFGEQYLLNIYDDTYVYYR